VLLVIDDVQWLDPASAAAIGFAVRRLERGPVGLLCAQRTAGPGAELPLELARARLGAGLLPVGGLSAGALHRMLRIRLGTSFSRPALRRIEAGSGGNPFIALEIGRAVVRRGGSIASHAALPVPDTLSGLVAERLRELPQAVLDALQLVAVMPDAPLGQYLAAGVSGAELDDAVLAGVLESDGGRLRFAHPLLAAAVGGAIPPARYRVLHACAASVVQRPEEQARHRALAATGPSASVAAELAAAARAAAARGAPATAAELFGLAASLTPDDHLADARRRRLDQARQLVFAGETRAAGVCLEELVASMPPGPGRAEALSQLGWLRKDDSGTAATALLEQALAEAGDDPVRTAGIHCALADTWSERGDQLRSLAEAHQALADAERADDATVLAYSLAIVVLQGFVCGAEVDERRLERALELERKIGGRVFLRTVPPSWVAGYCHLVAGQLDEAEQELLRVLSWADAEGVELFRASALLRLSQLAGYRGELQKAADLAAEGLENAEQRDLPQFVSALLYGCAQAALHLGQAAAVRDLSKQGLEMARRAGDRPYAIYHQALLGSLDLVLGDYPAAAARLRPLAAQWREMGVRLGPAICFVPDLAEALIAADELEEAAAIVAEMAHDVRSPLAVANTARCRGALAAARGQASAAVAELTEALRLLGQVSPQPLQRARTLLVLGAVQRRLKQRAAARATVTEAIGILDGIGAPLWAARGRAELARISGRAGGADNLTATERRVAELVARGMSNREAAAELFVSVRAVESTLTKTYAKLGLRSRTELATWLHGVQAAPHRGSVS
jgi:DNA-binding CsgD family transcriptional regulator